MTSIQDIPVEILAIIFGFQPNWVLPILGLVNTKFRHAVKLCSSKHENPTYFKIACHMAARGGHLGVLQWLRSQDPPCPWDEWTCGEAARGGHLGVLQWAREHGCPWNWLACRWAARGGHLEVLQWMREQDPPCPWDEYTCQEAAGGGHLEVLQWARDHGCPLNDRACRVAAARGGHLEVEQWLRERIGKGCPIWDDGIWLLGGDLYPW